MQTIKPNQIMKILNAKTIVLVLLFAALLVFVTGCGPL
jgi:hypothetical protein